MLTKCTGGVKNAYPMMKLAWYESNGPAADVLRTGAWAIPVAAEGEVLVRIRASGVNPSDTKMRAGWRGASMVFPRVVPHSDGAGDVVAVGAVGDLDRWSQEGRLRNAIGAVFDLADIARAHEAVEQHQVIGNVVIRIP